MQTSYPIPDVNALLTQLCLSISEVTGSTHTLRITLTLVVPFICQISDLCLFRTAKLRDSNCSRKKLFNVRQFQSTPRPDHPS